MAMTMTVSLDPLRRVLGAHAGIKRLCTATAALAPTAAPVAASPTIARPPRRHFAAAAAQAAPESYAARKAAAQQQRRDTWDEHQSRLGRLKTRRDGRPRDAKKAAFRAWWDQEAAYHRALERTAKREGRPWRVRVAAMVERLPVVTPDVEPWEREYTDLRDYLWTYGKDLPEETGFMYAPDKPEDHVVPTDEELLAGLPFTVAPRETEADRTGDVQTRDRQLKDRVFLALKTDAEGVAAPRWTLPSALVTHEETLLGAAQRAVTAAVGTDLALWCPSNAPMTVNLRKYGKNAPDRGEYFGEKIFYYRVQYDHGDVDAGAVGAAEEYAWLTRGEVVERVTEERGAHQAKFFHYML